MSLTAECPRCCGQTSAREPNMYGPMSGGRMRDARKNARSISERVAYLYIREAFRNARSISKCPAAECAKHFGKGGLPIYEEWLPWLWHMREASHVKKKRACVSNTNLEHQYTQRNVHMWHTRCQHPQSNLMFCCTLCGLRNALRILPPDKYRKCRSNTGSAAGTTNIGSAHNAHRYSVRARLFVHNTWGIPPSTTFCIFYIRLAFAHPTYSKHPKRSQARLDDVQGIGVLVQMARFQFFQIWNYIKK